MSANPEASPKKGSPRLIALVALAAAAASYGGYRVYLARKPYEWSGTVEARAISVGSRAGGRVKEVLVHEGDRVAPGQPILTFEPADWPAQLVQAEARVAQLEANLEKLQRGARPEEIAQAKARALTAQAALSQALAGSRPEQVKAAEARLAAQELAVERARLEDERTKNLESSRSDHARRGRQRQPGIEERQRRARRGKRAAPRTSKRSAPRRDPAGAGAQLGADSVGTLGLGRCTR